MIRNNSLEDNCSLYLREEPDPALRHQVISLLNNESTAKKNELADQMNGLLKFGTAGLRGRMEAGYNRLNQVSVYRFGYGLFQALSHKNLSLIKVVIGFDIRRNSQEFAKEVADVLGMLGAKVHLFVDYVPTPLCAYATRKLGADVGVMITASHNPYFDNGIKVYNADSSQAFGVILQEIENGMELAPLRCDFYKNKLLKTQPQSVGEELFVAYLSDLHKTRLLPFQRQGKNIDMVYTPLHGVGKKYFIKALQNEKIAVPHIVPEQAEPDSQFSSVAYPNPEEKSTLDMAHSLADKLKCDWVLANDPDADRLQVSYRTHEGIMQKLSGNEMGAIFGYLAIRQALEEGMRPVVATSIVSSMMLKKMAQDMGAQYAESCTGFGNIVQAALAKEKERQGQFVFAYEEAIGFMLGQTVLDKDGIGAGVRFMEVASFLAANSQSPWDFLDELYTKFGIFSSTQWSIRFSGGLALEKMHDVMYRVRHLEPGTMAQVLGVSECRKIDLAEPKIRNSYMGIVADVVIFEQVPDVRLLIRPSGTEPKIKIYLENVSNDSQPSDLYKTKEILNERAVHQRQSLEKILRIEE